MYLYLCVGTASAGRSSQSHLFTAAGNHPDIFAELLPKLS
jgi:hypothetical protein